jgi:hypothetical protein
MKIIELLVEATGTTKGSWKIQNLTGAMKTFKDDESPEARAWMRARGDASQVWDKTAGRWITDPKKQEREDRKAEREAAKYEREDRRAERESKPGFGVDLQKVYDIVMDAIGNSFPDGDPSDHYARPIRRLGVKEYHVGEVVTMAMKKHGSGIEKKGVYAYLAQLWGDMANDAMHDALNGHGARAPFVRLGKGGKPELQDNPWEVAEGEVIQAKFGKEKERADIIAKGKPMTMMQAFGSDEMNILHDAGIKLTEKPSYWEDFEGDGWAAKDNIHELKLKKAEKALGGKFQVIKGTSVYGPVDKPKGPQVSMKQATYPNMFIIEFGDGTRYLVDVTQSRTYIRMWQKIV